MATTVTTTHRRSFFSTVQLVMAGNDVEGLRYGVIDTPEKYWLRWKEAAPHPDAGDNPLLRELGQLVVQAAQDLFMAAALDALQGDEVLLVAAQVQLLLLEPVQRRLVHVLAADDLVPGQEVSRRREDLPGAQGCRQRKPLGCRMRRRPCRL